MRGKKLCFVAFHLLTGLLLSYLITSDQSMSSYAFALLTFSGYHWNVIRTNAPEYPGPNIFSSNPENVWIDSSGALHLRITYRNGVWNCAEVVLDQYSGYGVYTFYVDSDFTTLDDNIVAGLFLYRDDMHEYDIEFSRWGNSMADVLQYSIQPYSKDGNSRAFPVHLTGAHSSHQILWSRAVLEFTSLHGHYQNSPGADFLLARWQRPLQPDEDIPGAVLHINLWLANGHPAQENSTKEIVISQFHFTPLQKR